MFNKTVIVVSWMSWSGKSTLVNKFLEENTNFSRIPNYATREKRYDNEEDYIFISKEDFLEKRRQKIIIDTTKTFDKKDWYGLWKLPSDKSISILTPTWVNFLKDYCKEFNHNFLSILLNTDKAFLVERLKNRWENDEFIFSRLKRDMKLFKWKANLFDITLDWNKSIEEVYLDFNSIINKIF